MRWRDESGQSTVEFAVLLLAFLGMVVTLGLLWRAGREGLLVERSVASASHGAAQGPTALLKDVLGY